MALGNVFGARWRAQLHSGQPRETACGPFQIDTRSLRVVYNAGVGVLGIKKLRLSGYDVENDARARAIFGGGVVQIDARLLEQGTRIVQPIFLAHDVHVRRLRHRRRHFCAFAPA